MGDTQVPHTLLDAQSALPSVSNAIAIASAKGGVGKSTVTTNLALSLVQSGAKVGLLDADIYGPSLPILMGASDEPALTPENKMVPVVSHGVSMMSVGFIAGEAMPVIWRGPLLGQAVQQFLHQVEWGELDYLLIDMPPGTGDIPLTLSQSIGLSGAVIVTTPQQVSIEDVERGIAMFERVEVDVLGVVENMSYFLCADCGQRHEIFSAGGGRGLAAKLGLNFLGEIPLESGICAAGDRGKPIVLEQPESPVSKVFNEIGRAMVQELLRLEEDG
jgi:ATP-binding protein involved in chromosome partitioning